MERRPLGNSGLQAGVIGMGTWRTFDVPPDDRAAVARRAEITREAVEHGVDFFDSSPMYGSAEEVLGRCLRPFRDRALVATKVWTPHVDEGHRQIDRAFAFYDGRVDFYQVHNLVGWQHYLPILRGLRGQEKVRAVGITHYAASAFGEMRRIMESEDIQTIQIPYNAADSRSEPLLDLATARGIGVIVMSPLGSGDLVRRSPPARELSAFEQYGVETWAQALLKWVVSDQRVSVVIPATSRPGRMTENARAGESPFLDGAAREHISHLARGRR
jgi:aryl-alcohol dehydrogenase-like predicted oxidoreductase